MAINPIVVGDETTLGTVERREAVLLLATTDAHGDLGQPDRLRRLSWLDADRSRCSGGSSRRGGGCRRVGRRGRGRSEYLGALILDCSLEGSLIGGGQRGQIADDIVAMWPTRVDGSARA